VLEVAVTVLVTTATAIAVNKVSDQWSWGWVALLAMIVFVGIAVGAAEALGRDRRDDPDVRPRPAFLGLILVAVLGVAGVFVTLWAVPHFQAPRSCVAEQSADYPLLDYRCDLRWESAGTAIPIFRTPSETAEKTSVLYAGNGSPLFLCQTKGDNISRFGGDSDYWAFTQGDEGLRWGYVSQVHFREGLSNKPDGRLRECTDEDRTFEGTDRSQK
jgi:hypothetical protein